ncbi:MAG: nuclear transport factor 2 family protein [Caulobacteraceae bacterium]|nr:nuclear transport factor 2 family protein [Caulobacteraceae bacterium]
MPSPATVEAFLSAVESGDHVGAIERFYAPDASMQENQDEPRVGRDRLVAHEVRMLRHFDSVSTERLGPALVDGDHVAIRWRFGFHRDGHPPILFEEVAWQTWKGDLIQEETFFYDPKQREA